MKLTDIGAVKALMGENAFKKQYGQNFLISESVPRRIASLGLPPKARGKRRGCLEIGPGIGTLTRALAEEADRVVAVEIDESLLPILAVTLADYPHVTVIQGDAMKLDLAALVKEHFADCDSVALCANLPYYITSPLLMKILTSGAPLSSVTVMVQKEVAQRLTASAGQAAYGAITAAVAYYGKVSRLFEVPAGCFMPKPKVDSAVVKIELYPAPPVDADRELLFRVIKGAFAQRRKTLANSLTTAFPHIPRSTLAEAIVSCGWDANIRGEALSLADFAALANALANATAKAGL